jgi:hypothetical protein
LAQDQKITSQSGMALMQICAGQGRMCIIATQNEVWRLRIQMPRRLLYAAIVINMRISIENKYLKIYMYASY